MRSWPALPAAVRERVSVTEMESAVGGGSLPGATLESIGLVVIGPGADALASRLRTGEPAVVGRVESGAVLLDLRTIEPSDDAALGPGAGSRACGPGRRGAEGHVTVVIGTAGHIDHGKTTLLRALTGIDADRLPEEQRRGMTIDVGYAHLTLPDGTELDFVDVPGHDRLVGNMLVGAGEIDAAMLVVAADDGPRAQTIEHLALLDALGIGHGLAVVTKADVAGPERTAEVVAAVERLLEGTTLAGSPVLAVSSVDGDGVAAVHAALVRPSRSRARIGRARRGRHRRLTPRDRPRLLGQGPRRRRDRDAARATARSLARRSGSCRATGPSASARSRSTAPASRRLNPGGRR